MNYVGIDIHKRYSVCAAQDERGRKLATTRIEGSSVSGFVQFFQELGGRSRVVIEACWNWQRIYELLEEIEPIEEIVVSNPWKTRLIADAQIKTDKLDAQALATLLRGNLVARIHVPSRAVRLRKEELRQRLYWARLRTRIRNRIHALLDRQRELELPQCRDLFGARGKGFLRRLELPEPEGMLLREDLALLETLDQQIKAQQKRIAASGEHDPATRHLLSIPGLGPILAAVIAAEIADIERFSDAAHLCAFAGLVPTTHASGGKIHHGKLLWACNKWLRWAFIEGAWVAIGCSPYFGTLYRRHRARGKKANVAITIVARRMATIVWHLLHEERDFRKEPAMRQTKRKTISPAAPV